MVLARVATFGQAEGCPHTCEHHFEILPSLCSCRAAWPSPNGWAPRRVGIMWLDATPASTVYRWQAVSSQNRSLSCSSCGIGQALGGTANPIGNMAAQARDISSPLLKVLFSLYLLLAGLLAVNFLAASVYLFCFVLY